jgi:hypothetical protein
MFQKGKSGNPKGRPPATINGIKPAELRERILDASGELLNVLIQAALNGDTRAAMYLLDKVLPDVKEAAKEPPPVESIKVEFVGVTGLSDSELDKVIAGG